MGNSTYVVQEDNDCIMYCDSHLTTAIKCNDGSWTGEPELGFWCYSEPAGSESTPAPWDEETTPEPSGGESTTAPSDEETTPEPSGSATTPAPSDEETTPEPSGSESTTAPSEEETTPEPSGHPCCPYGKVQLNPDMGILSWNPTVEAFGDTYPTLVLKKD